MYCSTIDLMMNEDDLDVPLLKAMPNNLSTVLHYVCTHQNFQVGLFII